MSWSRRRVLAGLVASPSVACSLRRAERTPPTVPSGAQISLPVIHDLTSDDGPSLLLVEDRGLPLVAMAIAIPAGHRHEPVAHPGMASVASSMVLEGMNGGSKTELLARYGDLGARPGTSMGPSLLVLGCTVHRDEAASALQLMAQTLHAPTMGAEAFERTLREHREWATVARGEPAMVTGLGLLTASLGVEPPSTSLGIGTPRGLDGLKLDAVRAYLAEHVRRDEAIVLMAGDVDEEQAWRWIEQALEDWPSTSPSPPGSRTELPSSSSPAADDEPPDGDSGPWSLASSQEPSASPSEPASEAMTLEPLRSRALVVPWLSLPQAFIAVGGPRAPYGQQDEPGQAVATSLLASTLQYELRTRQRSTYTVQSRVWRTSGGDVQQLWVRVDPSATGRALEAIGEQLDMLESDLHFSERIVSEVRQGAELNAMLSFHGPEATLQQLVRLAEAGLPADTPRRRLAWLREVDARRVSDALLEVLRDDRRCWCVAGDPTAIEQAIRGLPQQGRLTRTPEALLGLG